MTDQPQDQNLTNPEPAQVPTPPPAAVTPTATAPDKTGGKTYTEAEVEQVLKDRLDRQKKRDREEAAAATEKARQEAEAEAARKNGEWEKLAKQNEEKATQLAAQLRARELADLKRSIAERVGLPAGLAQRLVGDEEKDIEADAKALLETLPKPATATPPAKPQPGMLPANPGQNAAGGETDQQRLNRLHGLPGSSFDTKQFRQTGGGVYYVEQSGKDT